MVLEAVCELISGLVEQTFTSKEPLLPCYYMRRRRSSRQSWRTIQFCFLLLLKWKHLRFGVFHHTNVRNPFLFNPRRNLPNVGFYSLQSRRREMCFAYKMLLLQHSEPWIKYCKRNHIELRKKEGDFGGHLLKTKGLRGNRLYLITNGNEHHMT